jgi:hypothetical protein
LAINLKNENFLPKTFLIKNEEDINEINNLNEGIWIIKPGNKGNFF